MCVEIWLAFKARVSDKILGTAANLEAIPRQSSSFRTLLFFPWPITQQNIFFLQFFYFVSLGNISGSAQELLMPLHSRITPGGALDTICGMGYRIHADCADMPYLLYYLSGLTKHFSFPPRFAFPSFLWLCFSCKWSRNAENLVYWRFVKKNIYIQVGQGWKLGRC